MYRDIKAVAVWVLVCLILYMFILKTGDYLNSYVKILSHKQKYSSC